MSIITVKSEAFNGDITIKTNERVISAMIRHNVIQPGEKYISKAAGEGANTIEFKNAPRGQVKVLAYWRWKM